MKFFIILILSFQLGIAFKSFKSIIKQITEHKSAINEIKESLNKYLSEVFPNYKNNSKPLFDKCFDRLFEINNGLHNFIYSLSYSGKNFSDLGNEYSCIQQGFSYFLISYDYNYENNLDNYISNFFEFLEKHNFYTGLCLPENCEDILNVLLSNYAKNDISNIKIKKIINDSKDCEDDICEYYPYYSLDKNGKPDNNKISKEKKKYKAFLALSILSMIFLGFEILISGLIFFLPSVFNKGKILDSKLIEGYEDEDEEATEEEVVEKVLYNNPSFSRIKNESLYEITIKIIYKYFSFSTNILALTLRKSIFYNNRNLEIIYKIKIFILILITFSTNFDVYIQFPSRNFFDELFYKEIYFFFLKFSSFGLDMFICLEGFEALFKFMSYYKKHFFDTGNKKMSCKGLIKFLLFSFYKIVSYIIIFFFVIYLSRYYIYSHYGGKLYSYYADNINNENILEIFNPKYSFLSYFFENKENGDEFLFKSKISLLFINEFCFFFIIIIIFFIGIRLKSKLYDSLIFFILLISYSLSYLCDRIDTEKQYNYNYNKIIQNVSLVKYPHKIFNHYLIGAYAGIICFYLRDFSTNNNPMMNDLENCPFKFLINIIDCFDYLNQKGRFYVKLISVVIQIFICFFYTIIINVKNKGKEKKDYIINLELNTSNKFLFYYESGVFIFCFCIIVILIFTKYLDKKNSDNHSILNLLYQISFSFVNSIYILIYAFYCYYETQFKLSYQNLWLSTFGFFFLLCIENLIMTMIFVMPFKMLFKNLLEKYLVIGNNNEDFRYKSYNTINNETLLNQFNPNFQEDDLEN